MLELRHHISPCKDDYVCRTLAEYNIDLLYYFKACMSKLLY